MNERKDRREGKGAISMEGKLINELQMLRKKMRERGNMKKKLPEYSLEPISQNKIP